ncbi:MAG TPA: YhdP family protein, partial [Gammaproteobacteria bacterium]|nr:YhdP family protein [Gammaproteobacteria bacterium]
MRPWARKLLKIALIVAGSGVLLALAGTFAVRELLAQIPSYRQDLQAWVNRELGLQLGFSDLYARWGWRGPELTFRDASVAAAAGAEPFIKARTASIGVGPLRLIAVLVAKSDIGIDRLTLEGTELTLVKSADGAYRMQGAPASAGRGEVRFDVPPDIEVLVRDSRVLYLDSSRNIAWSFENVEASMRRAGGALRLEAEARAPRELASRITVTAQGDLGEPEAADRAHGVTFTGDWRISASADDVDLSSVGRFMPGSAVVPQAGNGDVSVDLEWRRARLVGGDVKLAFVDVQLPAVRGTAGSRFERIALGGDWRLGDGGWHIDLKDVAVTRDGRSWPVTSNAEIDLALHGDGGIDRLALRSAFLRLEDLTPFLSPLPASRPLDTWFALAPHGDLRTVSVDVARADDKLDYTLGMQFAGVGFAAYNGLPGVTALTGEMRADSRSGRVDLRTGDSSLDWPQMFRAPLAITSATGVVIWRQNQNEVRVVSDNLSLATPDASARTNLELTLPLDGSPSRLDLASKISSFAIAGAPKYLPAHKMPPAVVEWLDAALQGGIANSAEVSFVGPLSAFPFDHDEGQFRAVVNIEHARLAYVEDWPWAEDLDGTVEFVNASFAARGSGRVLGNRAPDVQVTIPDMRSAVFLMKVAATGPFSEVLAYLDSSPLIAQSLGPAFDRLEAPKGMADVSLDLKLPLQDRAKYDLKGSLKISGGELAFRGFAPHASDINGTVTLARGALGGDGIRATFLDGPVTIRVDTPPVDGYRTRISLDGEVGIEKAAAAFDLPFGDQLAGGTTWRGSLLIPSLDTNAPPRITVDSNLAGVAVRLPAPFEKAPAEPTNLTLQIEFPQDGGLDVRGNLGSSRRFAVQFDPSSSGDSNFEFKRAALRFGGAAPEFRAESGVTFDGSVGALDVDAWLALPTAPTTRSANGAATTDWAGAFAGAELESTDLTAFSQKLGATKVSARRRTDDWQIEVDSGPIAGTLLVPVDLTAKPQVIAVMRRLFLNAGGEGSTSSVDPRHLPGLQLHADAFALSQRQLGRVDAEVLSDPLGLRLVSFESTSESFSAQGSGAWFVGDNGDTTRFAVSLTSTNVAKTLDQLGFDPIIEAQGLDATASVHWPGPPTGDWMAHVGGDVSLHATKGSLLDVAPGAGRMIGLLSLSALPRRLTLDFRDVFNKGLAFDDIKGNFVVIDGNAYTDNLKLTGPVAEIGVIGRTGLRDHDYHQQAVVTSEPSNLLPTVGLLGGPAVAAALLIFTRVFKEPLKGLGRVSYCVSGSWQEPSVERLTA